MVGRIGKGIAFWGLTLLWAANWFRTTFAEPYGGPLEAWAVIGTLAVVGLAGVAVIYRVVYGAWPAPREFSPIRPAAE